MIAVYDLDQWPTTYDFLYFLIAAKNRAMRVRDKLTVMFMPSENMGGFKKGKMPLDHKQHRMQKILIPSCSFVGADHLIPFSREEANKTLKGKEIFPYEEYKPDGVSGFYNMVNDHYKAFGWVAKLKHPEPQEKDKTLLTITVRNSFRYPERNSNMVEWEKFAERQKEKYRVVFIPDTECEGVGDRKAANNLMLRMGLYQQAHMNFFVSNGPAALCMLSDAPHLTFKIITGVGAATEVHMKMIGLENGQQWPYAGLRQRHCWEDDTCEAIEQRFKEVA